MLKCRAAFRRPYHQATDFLVHPLCRTECPCRTRSLKRSASASYSFTEKKRIRKSFASRPSVLEVPSLLDIQLRSYEEFLQANVAPNARNENVGLQAAFKSIFPIVSHNGYACLKFINYELAEPEFDVSECQLRGLTYCSRLRAKIRLEIYDREAAQPGTVKEIRENDVYMGEVPLMTEKGSFIVNGTERVIVSQLHRSPGIFFEHDKGKTHSSGKLLFSARVIPYRGSWLDFEFDAKDILYFRVDRRRKMPGTILLKAIGFTAEDILERFFQFDTITLNKKGGTLPFVPERLKGQTASFDIKDKDGNVVVQREKRVTAKHIRDLTKAGITSIPVPDEYLIGRVLGKSVVDGETGEIIANANDEISEELLQLESVDFIRRHARSIGYHDRAVLEMAGNSDWSKLSEAASAVGLFADRKIIEVRLPGGKPGLRGGAAIQAYVKHPLDGVVTIFSMPKPDWSGVKAAWWKALTATSVVVECDPIERSELPRWLSGRLARQGQSADREALEAFADLVEGNLLAAAQETAKLGILYGEKALTKSEIEASVVDSSRFGPDALLKAICLGQSERAARIVDALEGQGEPMPLVLMLVSNLIRSLIKLRSGYDAGAYGVKGVFATPELKRAARRLSVKKLSGALSVCAEIDRLSKGLSVPSRDSNPWIELKSVALFLAR